MFPRCLKAAIPGFASCSRMSPDAPRAGTRDWAVLASGCYWIDRATGIAGTIPTQVLPFSDAGVVEAALGFEQTVYATVGAPAAM